MPHFSGSAKKWLAIIAGVIVGLLIIVYISLGNLRFFMNHYLGLTFFSKDYLIVLQNNYESRPGGGFITAYGHVGAVMGVPTRFSFHNSYEIDTPNYVTPPYPQEKFLKNEWYKGYTFRDANWQPNFPDSAKELTDFYTKKFPDEDVDGVIVVNFSMIENLVDALGGVTVDGQKLTKANLFSALEQEVNNVDRHSEEALATRKNILGDLASTLISKAKWHPFKTRRVLEKAMAEKDLYFWFQSQGLENKIISKNWGNALVAPAGSDFVSVNIANLGSKKTDRYMIKEVNHYVNLTKELPEMTTELTIRFPGFLNAHSDNYKGYARFILSSSAEVKQSPTDSHTESAQGLTMVGTEFTLPAGSKMVLSVTYILPRAYFTENSYRLRLAKQSGSEMEYKVVVEAPAEREMRSIDFEVRENRAMWGGMLKTDKDLALSIQPDTLVPFPIEQVFEGLNNISIYWNEPMDPSIGNNATAYTVTDMNITDPKTDEVKVTYAEVVFGSITKLELSGVTSQPLERYRVELKGLRDMAGNYIEPDPKIITVVQRVKGTAETTSTPSTSEGL